jgi:biotin operon repressor
LLTILGLSVFSGSVLLTAYAFNDKEGKRSPHPFLSGLTDEQREEIMDTMREMRQAGASREEIKAAVDAKLKQWGIEVPDEPEPRLPPWMSHLTEEQREEIRQLLESLRKSGVGPKEAREAIKAKLSGWGIKVSAIDGRRRHPLWINLLTEEQREEIRRLLESLRGSGASREESRSALDEKLKEWGIEIPTVPPD